MSEQVCAQSISSPADSPASRFPWLESKRGKKTTVTSGLKCSGLSESLCRVGWSVRMFLESCALPLPTLSKVWSVKAITPSCLLLKLRLSERRTGESASHLWPTATARDYKDGTAKSCANTPVNGLLGRAIHATNAGLFPTPTTGAGLCGGTGNFQQLKALRECGMITEEERRSMSAGNGGSMNPDWVEWLMGYPVGWTEV